MPINASSNHHFESITRLAHRGKISELHEMFFATSIYHFVNALSGIYIPLYLLNQLGYTLPQVLLFLAMIETIHVLLAYPAARLIARFGPKHIMVSSLIIAMLIFLALFEIPRNPSLVIVIIALEGLFAALYHTASHIHLSQGSLGSSRGTAISKYFTLNLLALAMGPVIGGLVIEQFGFGILIIGSILLLVAAIIPLLSTKEIYRRHEFDIKRLDFIPMKSELISVSLITIEAFSAVTIWAIFIFAFLQSYTLVGVAKSIMLITGAISTYIVGKFVDRYDAKRLLRLGSWSMGLIETLRLLMRTLSLVFIIDFVRGIFLPLKNIPYIKLYYGSADKQPRAEYIFVVETVASMALIVYLVVVMSLTIIWGNLWGLTFALGIGAAAAFGLGERQRKKYAAR